MSSSNFGSFLFGAAVGIGIGFYLNSEKGKEWRNNKWEEANDLEKRIEKKVEEAINKMKGKVNDAATKVKEATEK